jgi:purine-binding chemotaxis protein CheW
MQARSTRSPAEAPAAGGGGHQYLTFSLGDEVFAMNIANVREIIQYGPMTSVPLMPAFVRGMINLRGSVVPVIDLQARFGRGRASVGKRSCNVIFDAQRSQERVELGLLVDAVSAVVTIPDAQIEPPPNFGASVRREFISGMGKVGNRFVIILEPDRALDVEEMSQLCASAQQGEAAH